ncbi:DNA polymerase [Kitasatospora griseola]|uniref:DNA polymerase I n=1 Tax=Kitasatospora griseola TaxID=2064 RepID=A0A0D0PIU3_KITGR|nr:DNA polymerase [Kitasatospora griseola]KIQ62419.1 DNA polymerase [Kitasatospora griseola]
MRTFFHAIAGDRVTIRVPETPDDLDAFKRWARRAARVGPIALDTETTGLDIYSETFQLRTVQFGDAREAWVIHWERGGWFAEAARWVLNTLRPRFLIHNAPYDWLVLDQKAGVPLEALAPLTRDTQIMAVLIDPRADHEGGMGRALKTLSAKLIDPSAPDTQGDLTAEFRSLGLTKATGFAGIPLDHPTYNLYAGLDVILTARLYPILAEMHESLDVRRMLVDYEHEIARICATMTRTGLVLDKAYCKQLDARLAEEAEHFAGIARQYGVENPNSNKQIAEALVWMGETQILANTTKTGATKLDKTVLLGLADLDLHKWERLGVREPNPLADAIVRTKRANKWRTAYVEKFLTNADASGRIHPGIHTLAARTGRMSVSGDLAAQTLPSGDWMIRRALLADEDHVMVSCDFDAVEMRVLAALANVTKMKEAVAAGVDLHNFTASLVYGPDFTEHHRKVCKGVGFGTVYGGGPVTIARQTGAPEEDVRHAQAKYHRIYPEIRRTASRWEREARANGMVTVSLTGRRLPLDRDRAYAVVNYQVQSAARDVLGQSLIEMTEAGLLPYLRLPIHDEALASVPRRDAAEISREIERCMTMTLGGVPITAKAETKMMRSWGSLYGADY